MRNEPLLRKRDERERTAAMTEQTQPRIKCIKCNVYMKPEKTVLEYLGHRITHELPRCHKCGQVFVSEELVRGKMREVEIILEDK